MSKDWWDDLPHHPANQKEVEPKFTSKDVKDITDVTIDGIDFKDHPDYCDAYISEATWFNFDCTDEELEIINEDRDFVYDKVLEYLQGLGE
tara:strand:+ start:439 stop:711 length:273 start_codon:yes stop_codon:yes gene_type:complete